MKGTLPLLFALAVLASPICAQEAYQAQSQLSRVNPPKAIDETPDDPIANGDVVTQPQASNEDACGAVLCLAGMMMGQGGGSSCSGYIANYFAITVKSAGDFNPAKTAKKRLSFLQQCKSSDSSTQKNVNNKYGRSMGL